MNVSEALALIDEYISRLEDWELQEEYDKSHLSFRDFLREYGTDFDRVSRAITAATGMNISEIRDRASAEALREIIANQETSEVLTRRRPVDELRDPGQWALDNVKFSFGLKEVDPNEEE